MYITIVGTQFQMGTDVFSIGQVLTLKKDHDNTYDEEAIKVVSESGVTYGYVSNSRKTRAKGCHSAGFVYSSFKEEAKCRVMFVLGDKVIAEIDYPKGNQ